MFAIAKALRAYSSHDAHLYLPHNANFDNFPENDEPGLRNNYPSWIHKGRKYNLESALCFWGDNIISELSKYDLVILSSLAVSISPYLKNCKVFFFVTGGDLTVLPFGRIHRTLLYSGKAPGIKPLAYQWAQRRGIESVHKILTQPFFPFVNAIRKLGVPGNKIADAYFPIMIDTDRFRKREDAYGNLDRSIRKELDRYAFKLFYPSRVVINDHPHLVETGQCKKNDILVKAFADFIKENNIKDAGLYLIEKYNSACEGISEMKKLVSALGIEKFVVWLKPENDRGFTRDELVNIYSCSDAVADDFGAGWFGSICVEGFSCSRPVLSYVDEEAMKKIYRWHPFLSSNSIKGNAAFIKRCYFDKDFAAAQGALGRRWALEYHSYENACRSYARELERLFKECR
jgi:glycosyltransferase involved in cell wall biosynthesis